MRKRVQWLTTVLKPIIPAYWNTTSDLLPCDGRETKTAPGPSTARIAFGTEWLLVQLWVMKNNGCTCEPSWNVAARQRHVTRMTSDSQEFLAVLP